VFRTLDARECRSEYVRRPLALRIASTRANVSAPLYRPLMYASADVWVSRHPVMSTSGRSAFTISVALRAVGVERLSWLETFFGRLRRDSTAASPHGLGRYRCMTGASGGRIARVFVPEWQQSMIAVKLTPGRRPSS